MAFKRSFAVLFVLAASAIAIPHGGDSSSKDSGSCSKDEFWYPTKSCCLPHGGVPKPPSPPPGKSCPPTTWYWHADKSCCVPNHPPPANPPPPQCKSGYEWKKATQCCEPGSPTYTSSAAKPSQTPKGSYPPPNYGDGKPSGKEEPPKYEPPKNEPPKKSQDGGNYKKRSAAALCPRSLEACPVGLLSNDYECLDTAAELRSCGGCASTGKGQNCNTIEGAWNVGCEAGSCAVYTCELGYKVASNGKSCVKN